MRWLDWTVKLTAEILNVNKVEYGYPEKRRKGKDKKRDKKRHPYRKGGGRRGMKDSKKD
jgi:hypothetical protein